MPNESKQLHDFKQAMGAFSELCWMFYNDLLSQGFSAGQALHLTTAYLQAILLKPATPEPSDPE